MFTFREMRRRDSNQEAAKRTAEFLFAGFDAGSLLSPKSTIEDKPKPMLRDVFMTPTAGPEEVWEQFGMSKVRSIKARGYQSGSPVVNVVPRQLEDLGFPGARAVYRLDYSGSALGAAPLSDSLSGGVGQRGPNGTICGRAAPYG